MKSATLKFKCTRVTEYGHGENVARELTFATVDKEGKQLDEGRVLGGSLQITVIDDTWADVSFGSEISIELADPSPVAAS